MRPVLVELGPLQVNAWGFMAALAVLASARVAGAELQRRGHARADAWPLVLAGAIGGLIGAKLYFLAEHPDRITDAANLLSGEGFTWYGGVLGGTLAVLAVARRRGLAPAVTAASLVPALALAYAIGRIGCQLAGDGTYGTPTDVPWAMSYPDAIVPTTQRVHPTPIYETLAGLLIFAILWRLRTRLSEWRLVGVYLVLSGAERFAVEFVRRNEEILAGLTQPQLWALGGALAGLALVAAARPRRPPQPAAAGFPRTL